MICDTGMYLFLKSLGKAQVIELTYLMLIRVNLKSCVPVAWS